jgi:dTDP-4-amino-4,6-dideoxygalactose transaminase
VLAAFLYAQLEQWQTIQQRRRAIWEKYDSSLKGWAHEHKVVTPHVPAHCEQAYHMYYLLLPSLEARALLIAHLKSRGILSVFHYLPLHLSDMGRKFGGRAGDCPVTEDVSDRLLRLPFYNRLTEVEQQKVVDAIHEFAF